MLPIGRKNMTAIEGVGVVIGALAAIALVVLGGMALTRASDGLQATTGRGLDVWLQYLVGAVIVGGCVVGGIVLIVNGAISNNGGLIVLGAACLVAAVVIAALFFQ